jgi:hypothetical protein
MPVDESTTLAISCDNPACPGHSELDPAERTGWLFVTHEVYGEPTMQHVFGDYACLSAASGNADVVAEWTPPALEAPVVEEAPAT